MATQKELLAAIGSRYRAASRREKGRILDEFVATTGYHRKQAIRALRSDAPSARPRAVRNRLYDDGVKQALIVLWEASDRLCGKRLKASIPDPDQRDGAAQPSGSASIGEGAALTGQLRDHRSPAERNAKTHRRETSSKRWPRCRFAARCSGAHLQRLG